MAIDLPPNYKQSYYVPPAEVRAHDHISMLPVSQVAHFNREFRRAAVMYDLCNIEDIVAQKSALPKPGLRLDIPHSYVSSMGNRVWSFSSDETTTITPTIDSVVGVVVDHIERDVSSIFGEYSRGEIQFKQSSTSLRNTETLDRDNDDEHLSDVKLNRNLRYVTQSHLEKFDRELVRDDIYKNRSHLPKEKIDVSRKGSLSLSF